MNLFNKKMLLMLIAAAGISQSVSASFFDFSFGVSNHGYGRHSRAGFSVGRSYPVYPVYQPIYPVTYYRPYTVGDAIVDTTFGIVNTVSAIADRHEERSYRRSQRRIQERREDREYQKTNLVECRYTAVDLCAQWDDFADIYAARYQIVGSRLDSLEDKLVQITRRIERMQHDRCFVYQADRIENLLEAIKQEMRTGKRNAVAAIEDYLVDVISQLDAIA
jgi:hypothetical protein